MRSKSACRRSARFAAILTAAVYAASAATLRADTVSLWTNSSNDGIYGNANNWSPTGVPNNTGGTSYTFMINSSTPVGPTMFSSATVDGGTIQSGAELNIEGASKLTLAASALLDNEGSIRLIGGVGGSSPGILAGTTQNNGTLLAVAGASITPATLATLTGAGTLAVGEPGVAAYLQLSSGSGPDTQGMVTVATGSTLDMTNNKLVINYGSNANDPIKAIVADLTSGYNHGHWTGTGISSSASANDPQKLPLGYLDGNVANDATAHSVAPNQIIIKYTLAGDCFLEGTVGFDDLVVIAQNFTLTGKDWAGGNFTYDPNGSVGFADLVDVAANYGFSLPNNQGSAAALLAPAWQTVSALPETGTAVTPEPGSFALLAVGAGALLARRRRLRRN